MDAAIVSGQSSSLSTGSSRGMSATPAPTAELPVHPAHNGIDEQGPSEQDNKASKGRKTKKKRVITEARKEQNRIAQRAFRQRQKELGQRAKAEAKNQSALSKQREILPRRDETGGSQSLSDTTATTNHVSFLPSPSASDDALHESISPTSAQDFLALIPSPPVLGSALSQPSMNERELEEVPRQLALPDPSANTQEFFETTFFSAILHNALALGFDLETIADCSIECMSPFYRPTTPQDDPTALLASTVSSLAVEPPAHLRPTLAQVLIPHHASLDLIPLPHLRDRAIMLSAAMPTVFNIWELKVDIYERGGLNVYKGNGRGWRGQQPWQRESWVAAPWFLRKWSMCVEAEKEQLSAHSMGRVGEITGDHVGEFVV